MEVRKIPKRIALDLIRNHHYSRRCHPIIWHAFGVFDGLKLLGVATYRTPPSPTICIGPCGREYRNEVIELNRLFLVENRKNLASLLIGRSMKLLPAPAIVISYSDTAVSHHGYIYQASNFLYTGKTAAVKEANTGAGWHWRAGWKGYQLTGETRPSSQKHRYVYFVGNRREVKERRRKMRYPVLPYPKGDNETYDTRLDLYKEEVCLL